MATGTRLILFVAIATLCVMGTATRTAAQCIVCDPGDEDPYYEVTVTPAFGSFGTLPANATGDTVVFKVTNTGNTYAEVYYFSCTGTNGVTCSESPGSAALSPGFWTTVTVTITTGSNTGPARVSLEAESQHSSSTGHKDGVIERYSVSVTPDGGDAPTRTANTGGYSQTFTVKNTGTTSNFFTFDCTDTGGVICGSDPSPVTLAAGAQTTRTQTYSVGGPSSGTLRLTAHGSNGASNMGSYDVPIVSYGVSVTPNGVASPTREANTGGHSQTFTIKNTGSASNTFTFTCSGTGGVTCGSAPSSVTLAAGAQTARSQSYSVGAPGYGTLKLTASGTNASDQGSYTIPIVSYGVSVTPDGADAPTRTANTGGHSQTFTIKNTGSATNTFTFTCSDSGGVTCGSPPSSATLAAGAQTTRSQSYSVGGPGTGTLKLTASGTNASNQGSYDVPIVSYGVSVTPDGADAPTRTANTSGHNQTFTIKNTGSASNTFTFTCSGTGGVTCGAAPSSATLAAGAQTTRTQSYSVGAPGTGTLKLTASGANASNQGSYDVSIVSYGVSVTPDGADAPTRTANTGGHSQTFTIKNTGSASNTFTFTCSGTGGVTCGAAPSSATLAAGAQTTRTQSYSVGAPGSGTLKLTASGTNASNQGSYNVSIVSYGVSVTPDGANAPTRTANTGGHSQTFTIKNTGSASNTFTFTCSDSGGVTCGSDPSSVTLAAGAQTTRTQGYSVGAPGSGTLKLTASGTNASNQGSYNVSIVSYGVSVTPDGASAPVRTPNTGGHSQTFTIKNTGSATNTFTFTCSDSGGVICGPAPSSATLAAGAQTTRTQSYSVGAAGSGTLTLTASGTNASNQGSYSVPIVSYGVSVTPDGADAPTRTPYSVDHEQTFTVKNTGSTSNTYSFTCTSTGGVACGPAPSSVTLAAGAQTTRTQSYSVGAPGTGTLALTASGTNATNQGSYTVAISAVAGPFQSVVEGGAFTMDSRYVLQETADAYDAYGRITQLTDARGKVTTYEYGGNINDAFLTRVTRVKDGGGAVDLVTELAYNTNGYVESVRDEGGSYRRFSYDALGRLSEVRNHANVLVEEYDYQYSRTSANGWSFQAASPNAVTTTTHLDASQAVVTRQYLDGLGRPVQSNVQDGATYHVTATEYDAMGRPWRAWKPYPRSSANYDPNFASNAANWYDSYHGVSNAKPYAETQYTADALSRVKAEIPAYIGSSASEVVQYAYGVDAANDLTYTEVSDEAGKKVRRYQDLFGREVKTILGYDAPEATTTLLAYDALGRRTQATDPRGLVTTYAYDGRGALTRKTSPDAGTINHKYDSAGNLRYSQDANQEAAGEVHFTTYDFAGRPLASGVGSATFSSLDPDATSPPSLETTASNWHTVWAYDAKPSAGTFPWSQFATQINSVTLTNVAGRPAAVASQSNGAWQLTLYSYDTEGQLATRHTFTEAEGGGSVLTALNTTVAYVRDRQGTPTERRLTVGSQTFNHWYEYDGRGLLAEVYSTTSSTKSSLPSVAYTYGPGGEVESRKFADGPVVPMRYTIRGQLQRIGNPASTSYPFSARYAYHPNGTVSESEFYSAGSPVSPRYRYTFGTGSYDALNRLRSADYSYWSGSAWSGTSNRDLAGLTYDDAGNLKTLQRYGNQGTLVDNLSYSYPSTSNRLSSVADAVSATGEGWDAEDGSFSYDANGNLKSAPAPYSITAATYDHRNLPLSLTSGGVTTSYRYDHAGQRITKRVGAGSTGATEVYLLEGATPLAVFTVDAAGTPTSWHFNVTAGDRVVGRAPHTGGRRYYHTDLLGSTRAVVAGTSVLESYDYDPWGVLMPGRTLAGDTKEGFTGKERDAESGLDYFGARLYMAALGRWTTVDPPADSFPEWNPYNYVENNPVAVIDPSGLCPFCPAAGSLGRQLLEVRSGIPNRLSTQLEKLNGILTTALVHFGGSDGAIPLGSLGRGQVLRFLGSEVRLPGTSGPITGATETTFGAALTPDMNAQVGFRGGLRASVAAFPDVILTQGLADLGTGSVTTQGYLNIPMIGKLFQVKGVADLNTGEYGGKLCAGNTDRCITWLGNFLQKPNGS